MGTTYQPPTGKEAFPLIYLVISLLFALLVAVFAIQNSQPVLLRFFGWFLETSQAVLLIGAASAGALVVGLLAFFRQLGMGLKLMDERSRAHRAGGEAEQARLASNELRKELGRLQEQNRRLAARLGELGKEAPATGSPPGPPPEPGTDEEAPGAPAAVQPPPGDKPGDDRAEDA